MKDWITLGNHGLESKNTPHQRIPDECRLCILKDKDSDSEEADKYPYRKATLGSESRVAATKQSNEAEE